MKKLGFVILGVSIMLSSCLKEEAPRRENGGLNVPEDVSPDSLAEMTITVTAPMTRTALADTDKDGVKDDVVWTAGDAIGVWDGYANRKFVLSGEPNGNKAEFRGVAYYRATKVYAVYPYSETFITEVPPTDVDETGVRGYARMLFPNSQYQLAVPNGFDKNAAFAVAESNNIHELTFNQRTALLKFSLAADMNDVVAVKFEGNESNDYIWGTVSTRFLDGGLIYPGIVNTAVNPLGRGKQITMKNEDSSALTTGVDYHMVVPATLFGRGYKLTFEHADGSESVRSSAKSIEYNTSQIYALASTEISKTMVERYSVDYNKNGSLTITGHSPAKGTFGGPTIITSDQTYTITTGGAYFIEPGAQVTINITSPTKNIMIVGDCKSEMSVVSLERSIPMQEWGNLFVLNMDFTFKDFDNNMISNTNNITNLSHVAFEDCCLRYESAKSILHSTNTSVTHIRFYDNDIIFSYDKQLKDIYMFSTDTSDKPTYDTFIFSNNLFYHKGNFNSESQAFALTRGDSKTIKEVSLNHNTFINLKTRTEVPYYIGGTVTKIYAHNNLFYLPNQGAGVGRLFSKSYEPDSSEDAQYRVRQYGVTVFKPEDKVFKFSNHATEGTYILGSDPFTLIDVANGVFQKGDLLYPGNNLEIGAKQDRTTGKRIRQNN